MIKRVLSATINYDHEQVGMRKAFQALVTEYAEFDYLAKERGGQNHKLINHEFVQLAIVKKPDWIWLQLQDTGVIKAESLRSIKQALPRCVITHWTGDCRPEVSPYLSSICQATDMTLISNAGQIEMFRKAGAAEARYLQIGVDWAEDVIGVPDWKPSFRVPDVVFVGKHYGDVFHVGTHERVELIRALLRAKIDVGVVGRGWPDDIPTVGECTVKQQTHVYRRAKVALNINHFNDIALYYSDRQLIAMASGTPLVCKRVPDLDFEFVNHEHCVWFTTPDEAVIEVQRLLDNPDLGRRIGLAGRAEVIRNHTWLSRLLGLWPIVEKRIES